MADSVGPGTADRGGAATRGGDAEGAPRIAFVSGWDAEDPAAWSGVVRPMRDALARVLAVTTVHVRVADHPVDRFFARLARTFGRGWLCDHSLATAHRRGRALRRALAEVDADVVVAVACSTTVACARLTVPVVQVTDATVRALRGYYPQFTGLSAASTWQAELLERRSHAASAAVVVASQWARDSFVRDYGVDPAVVTVAPFGPGIAPSDADDVARSPGGDALRVLVVARDWARKGGADAVDAVARLRERGCPAHLTVVGGAPAGLPEWVDVLGRVSPRELSRMYREHDVLLELATANAGGVTLTDAAAHGLPAVATDTGGVPEIVRHGRSGLLVRSAHEVDRALDALREPAERARLADGAALRSRTVLDWDVWAAHVAGVAAEVHRHYGTDRQGAPAQLGTHGTHGTAAWQGRAAQRGAHGTTEKGTNA